MGLCFIPLVLIFLVVSSVSQHNHLNTVSNQVESNFNKSVIAGQIRADVKDAGIHLRNMVMSNNEETVNYEMQQTQIELENIEQNIRELELAASSEQELEMIDSLKAVNADFKIYSEEVISFIQEGNKDEAILSIEENSNDTQTRFSETIAEITSVLDTNLSTSMTDSIRSFENGLFLTSILIGIGILIILIPIGNTIIKAGRRIGTISELMSDIANGKKELDTTVPVIKNDEIDQVAISFNKMTSTLVEQITKEQDMTWTKTNITDITTSISGAYEIEALGQTLLSKLVPLVESSHAVFYVKDINDPDQNYKLISTYAYKERKHILSTIKPGEGIIGQAIFEKTPIILTNVPRDYIQISSGLGEAAPKNIYIIPIIFENEVKAVIELASFNTFSEVQQSFLEELMKNIGIVLDSVISRIQLAKLLEESQMLMEEVQAQSEELQNQQEELKATNEELEAQTLALRKSEEQLQRQQEELEETNTELEEKANRLEEQNIRFEETNRLVEKARAELEVKAEQLALSSKYKSEFLANMSHELRTPLNSLIILSKLLADNPNGNLSEKQIEYSKTIYSSGNDLLKLINNILDLAKIESGKTEIIPTEVRLTSIVEFIENNFKPLAEAKKLEFNVVVNEKTPKTIFNDGDRIQQVLNNLLSNAFKFTKQGEVRLEISHQNENGKPVFEFSVLDTGIGIAKDKQQIIFEAFQQEDGTTSRKFGGTGLGLSISRELASLLGGEIIVESEEGKGSKFTFYVGNYENVINSKDEVYNEAAVTMLEESLDSQDEEPKVKPNKANKLELTHMPKNKDHQQIKRLLIVDDDQNQRNSLMELIGEMDFVIKAVSSGAKAIELLKVNDFDCIILDLGLSDTSGFELLDKIKEIDEYDQIKIFVYTGRDLTSKEEMHLSKYTHTIIIKNEYSPDRLKAELQLYLNELDHSIETVNSQIEPTNRYDMYLKGKKILLVDDDVRNVFSLTSVLETTGCDVIFAENGTDSIKVLEENNDIDLVLMDIMMPEMDGYEAIKRIREKSKFKDLPIIALTAKAMKEDRDKCLSIGASDYIAKPVEPDQLISLIKVWLY